MNAAARIESPVAELLEAERIAKALEEGQAMCIENGNPEPRYADMVWALIEDAAQTFRRLPDRERAWLRAGERIAWPNIVYDRQELAEAFAVQVARVQAGEEPMEALQIRPSPPTARAIDRAQYVSSWRRHLVGVNQIRDWRILWLMAFRVKQAHIARELRCSRQTLHDRRELQTVAIGRALRTILRNAAGVK